VARPASKPRPKPPTRRRTSSVRGKIADSRSIADIKQQILTKATGGGKLSAKHHLKSLLFGVGMGLLVLFIILFGFFNERFIAPLISPSRNVSATPIIPTGEGVVSPDPKILIPKINVEVPVVYGLGTNEEKAVQRALEDGVVHYAGTSEPGQTGNVVIVGHSSNNILNKGKYKFAFVLLKRMEVGDTLYLQKGGQRYTYQVFENRVVSPKDVSVLGTTSRPNTVTLITCDPPGTAINRRIIVAEQISPDPGKNTAGSEPSFIQPDELPSNAPSLWQRIFGD
jgi:sortase A